MLRHKFKPIPIPSLLVEKKASNKCASTSGARPCRCPADGFTEIPMTSAPSTWRWYHAQLHAAPAPGALRLGDGLGAIFIRLMSTCSINMVSAITGGRRGDVVRQAHVVAAQLYFGQPNASPTMSSRRPACDWARFS